MNFNSAMGELEEVEGKGDLYEFTFLIYVSLITLIMVNFLIANVSNNYSLLEQN